MSNAIDQHGTSDRDGNIAETQAMSDDRPYGTNGAEAIGAAASIPMGIQLPVIDGNGTEAAAPAGSSTIDLAAIQERLTGSRGPQYWKSLDELAETEAFQEHVKYEFPAGTDLMLDPVSRRNFVKIMGASIALAGVSSCVRQPEEKIVPYVRAPEDVVPGAPLYYATAVTNGGYAIGVLAENHMGRPTKIEGNPDHPASLGSTDVLTQASILSLYDPDRSQTVMRRGSVSTWSEFATDLAGRLESEGGTGGAGLRIVTETITSPTLADQLGKFLDRYPAARWYQYDSAGLHNTRAGVRAALGRDASIYYDLEPAKVILSLDADFLASMPGSVRYSRQFSNGRRVRKPGDPMNRLYAVESTPTITGAKADHRLAMRASDVESIASAIAAGLGISGAVAGSLTPERQKWVAAVVKDLLANRGASVVMAGEPQPGAVHVLAHAINQFLGNVGGTVRYIAPVEAVAPSSAATAAAPVQVDSTTAGAAPVMPGTVADQMAGLRELAADMAAGRVTTLIMIGVNPVYSAPVDLEFEKAIDKVPFRVHYGLYNDETAWLSHWHLPASHSMEIWSDARAFDGTTTIIQPLIAPLYDSRSIHELVAMLSGTSGTSGHDIVRAYWNGRIEGDFEKSWQKVLHDGIVGGAAATSAPVSGDGAVKLIPSPAPSAAGLEINFRPDASVWDGQYSNNGWLQELPRPLSLIVWDNAALVSPATAKEYDVQNGDVVELTYQGRKMTAPIWIVPGHPAQAVTLTLGYGRTRAGRVGNGTGFNANLIRTSSNPWFGLGLEMRKTGEFYELVTVQDHYSFEGRNILRAGTAEGFRSNPDFVREMEHGNQPYVSLYPDYVYDGYAWGMAIDLTACTGCNACTIACQAENNIPVVGKKEVGMGREMHWIRVDRYFEGDLYAPQVHYQPLTCMHCEAAPCEVVCPVGATVHSDEGLNEMVYNRCVGTKYCSNNCPYKVRRFNFFQYTDKNTPSLKLQKNPDVTVRNRGMMEKCTYCVQRINLARIEAKKEDRAIRDGEVVTACQAVCPTEAIIFGNINDKESRIAEVKRTQLNYAMLAELNTKPRTSYLAKLRNPNPDLVTTENNV